MNTDTPVESPVRGNSHAGFGGRSAETERLKGRHRAPGRPYLATDALDEIRHEVWNEARRAGHTEAARSSRAPASRSGRTSANSPSASESSSLTSSTPTNPCTAPT